MLKSSVDRIYPCFVIDFRGKASSFSQLSKELAVGFFVIYVIKLMDIELFILFMSYTFNVHGIW